MSNKVEPKFNVGDVVVFRDNYAQAQIEGRQALKAFRVRVVSFDDEQQFFYKLGVFDNFVEGTFVVAELMDWDEALNTLKEKILM